MTTSPYQSPTHTNTPVEKWTRFVMVANLAGVFCITVARKICAIAVFSSSLVAFAATPQELATPRTTMSWREVEGKSVSLLGKSGTIWRFHFGSDAPKPFFHPIALTDGTVLTTNRPADHPWHHGLWFSWKYINKVNYWEPSERGSNIFAGRTIVTDTTIETRKDYSAKIKMELEYKDANELPVLTEQRTIVVASPDTDGGYQMDWTCKFTAGDNDVLLDRTPFSTNGDGPAWGGYAGLSCRFNKNIQDCEAFTTIGPATFIADRSRPKARGAEFNGLVNERAIGLALLDHPDNPRSPTDWYFVRSKAMKFINAAFLTHEPLSIASGESFVLDYRVIIHPGRWDIKRLKSATKSYANRSGEESDTSLPR